MIEWYNDNKITIFFSDTPHVCVRYITPSMTDKEKKSIKKYPFICKTNLNVAIFDHTKSKKYKLTINKGYCYDGASINRVFWRLIGAPTDNNFLIASLIHDVLCEHKEYINYDRALSTNVFNALLEVSDVNKIKRFLMKNTVACYQALFCDWGLEWNK